MKNSSIFLCRILFLSLIGLTCVRPEKAIIIDHLTDTSCNQDVQNPPVHSGEFVFSLAKLTTQTVQEIMVIMWIFPVDTTPDTKTIFSVYKESPLELIASLIYKGTTMDVEGNLKNEIKGPMSFLAPKEWNLLRILVRLAPLPGGQNDQMDIYRQSKDVLAPIPYQTITKIYKSGQVDSFDRSNLIFNFGYSSPLLPDHPSCSRLQNVVIEFNFASTEWDLITELDNYSNFRTTLLAHYDFFYSKKNPNTLMNFNRNFERIQNANLTTSTPIAIQDLQFLKLGPFSISEKRGLILYFEFKPLPLGETIDILTFYFEDSHSLNTIQQLANGDLSIVWRNDDQNLTSSHLLEQIVSQDWIQIVIKFVCTIHDTSWFEIALKATSIQLPVLAFQKDYLYSDGTFKFGGNNSNSQLLEIDNIRIYSGNYWKENGDCLILVDGDTQDCLLCKPTFLLSYQSGMKCVSSGISTIKQNIEDWTRLDCPLNMMHSILDGSCYCPYSFYRLNDSCMSCPTFCRGCTSSTQCIEIDQNRDASTGKCLNNLFDDGYNCIKRTFSFPERQNLWNDNSIAIMFRLYFSNSEMNLTGDDSFLFTLKLYLNFHRGNNLELGYFSDNGIELFKIIIQATQTSTIYDICFYYQAVTQLACFPIDFIQASRTYIGMWISRDQVISFVEHMGTFKYKLSQISALSAHVNPFLCLGDCAFQQSQDQEIQDPQFLFPISFYQAKFIRRMSSPLDIMDDFLKIIRDNSIQEIRCSFSKQPSSYPATIQNTSTKKFDWHQDFKLNNPSPFNITKGQSTKGISSHTFYYYPESSEKGFGISMDFTIQSITSEYIFFEAFQRYYLKFSFLPQLSRNEVSIGIKLGLSFLSTQHCSFQIGKLSFLAIIYQKKQINYDYFNTHIPTFEVVCDFQRETLKFQDVNYLPRIEVFTFKESTNNADLYLSSFNLHESIETYFDYTETDGCFMYIDFTNMLCLKTKGGKEALFQGKLYAREDCSKIIDGRFKWAYNPYINSCVPTDITYACSKIDAVGDEFVCIKCEDPHANPSNFCICFDGYALDASTRSVCEKCLDMCSTCSNFEQCLTCKGSGTTAPNCTCLNALQYITAKGDCENCQPQCRICEFSSDNCLDCSDKRVNPPTCECNAQYYSLEHSSIFECVPYDCSYKCDSCEYSKNNCVECGPNRTDPPECDCEKNYFEINKVCTRCAPRHYYNKSQGKCLPCSYRCIECAETAFQCTECDGSLYLYKSDCLCSDLSQFFFSDSGEIECSDGMDVTVSVLSKAGSISVVFTFEFELEPINFSEVELDRLVFLYFTSISQNEYEIKSGSTEGNKLILELAFKVSFFSQEGFVTFLTTSLFTSSENSRVLDKKYLQIALKFDVGSFVLKDGLYSSSESVDSALKILSKSEKGFDWIELMKQLQVVYYLINTLQPCSLFLLVNTLIPPNLYELLQISGLLIFPTVGSQQKFIASNNSQFYFFNESLELGRDVSQNSQEFLARFGISGSLIVTRPIQFIQYLIFLLLSIVTSFIVLPIQTKSNKIVGFSQITTMQPSKIERANVLFKKKTTACIEGGLLIFVLLTYNQFQNIHTDEFFNRLSSYVAGITLLSMGFVFVRVCFIHKSQNGQMTDEQSQLVAKLKKTGQLTMDYLNFQLGKKVFMALVTILAVEIPAVSCFLNAQILLVSLIFTIKYKPYESLFGNITKIIGESCQLIIWVIFLCVFIPFESQVHEEESVSDEDVMSFLQAGNVSIFAFLIFNAIYLLEFVFNIIRGLLKKKETIDYFQKPIRISASHKTKYQLYQNNTTKNNTFEKNEINILKSHPFFNMND